VQREWVLLAGVQCSAGVDCEALVTATTRSRKVANRVE
jgi:hypothetical protein